MAGASSATSSAAARAVLLVAVEAEGGSKNERKGKGQKLTAKAMS